MFSHLVNSEIKNNVNVGPFARMREHSVVNDKSRIGNFVELKKTTFEEGVKAGSLSLSW